jgi:hypothetical protein
VGTRHIEQVYCDRCGAVIDVDGGEVHFTLTRYESDDEEHTWDMCTKCFKEDPSKWDGKPLNATATKLFEPPEAGGYKCIFDIQHVGRCSINYMDLPDDVVSAPAGSTFRVHIPVAGGMPTKWDRVA